jgi:hypothetical protein
MINEIVKGISRALYETFGDEYTIYKDDVPQDFNEPCFMIVYLHGSIEQKSPIRYFQYNLFDIHYFPKDELNSRTEMRSVIESLFLSLEYINVLDNLCRGTKMSYEIIDDVLHFFVNYDMFVNKEVVKQADMKTLEQSSTLEVNNG